MSDTLAPENIEAITAKAMFAKKEEVNPTESREDALIGEIQKEMGTGVSGRAVLEARKRARNGGEYKVDGDPAKKKIDTMLGKDAADAQARADAETDPARKATLQSEADAKALVAQEAEVQEKLVREFLGKGYEALSPTDQLKMRSFVEQALHDWDAARDLIDDLTTADPARAQELVEQIINDPSFKGFLKSEYDGIFSGVGTGEAGNPFQDAKLIEAEKNFREANAAAIKAAQEFGTNQRKLQETYDLKAKHETAIDPMTGAPKGEFARRIQELDGLITGISADKNYLTKLQTSKAQKEATIADLEKKTGTKGVDNTALEAKILTLKGELVTIDGQITAYEPLAVERAKLIEQRDSLDAEKDRLESEAATKEEEVMQADVKNALAHGEYEKLRKEAEEKRNNTGADEDKAKEALKKKLDGIVTEASNKWIDAQLDKAIVVIDERWTKIEEEWDGKAEKAMIRNLKRRYMGSASVKDHAWNPLSRSKNERAEEDFATLLDPSRGVDVIFEDELLSIADQYPEEYFVYDMATQEPIGLSDYGRDRFDTVHKEFADKVKNNLTITAIETKIRTGGMSKAEARQVMESDWFAEAVESNEALSHKIEAAMKQEGAVGSKMKWLNEKAKSPLGLSALFLLLGPIPVGAIGAAWWLNRKGGGAPAAAH